MPFSQLDAQIDKRFDLKSRIHLLGQNQKNVFIKRDDELSASITGSKLRKYASLLVHLNQTKEKVFILIGSELSNHIFGIAQLFMEDGLRFHLLLKAGHNGKTQSQRIWLNQLVAPENISIISRENWGNLDAEIARLKSKYGDIELIKEGANQLEALPGAITLAKDILRNESESNLNFNSIFIDSGTGLTAIGLILGMAGLKSVHRKIFVTLIAGSEKEFRDNLNHYHAEFQERFKMVIDLSNLEIHVSNAKVAGSYGSITPHLIAEWKKFICEFGIIIDPIYSLKHYLNMEHIRKEQNMDGQILFVYSGGAFAARNFEHFLL